MDSSLRKNFAWALSGRVGRLVFRLASTLLLMRLIEPDVFGRVAMAVLTAEFLFMLLDWGLSRSMIYQEQLDKREMGQLNALHFLLGILAGAAIVLGWHWVEQFFKTELSDLLRWIFAIRATVLIWTVMPEAQLEREGLFKWMTQVELVTYVLAVIPALFLAYFELDEMALSVREVLPSVLMLAVLIWVRKDYAHLSFGTDRLGRHFQFGLPITVSSILVFLSRRLDDLLIGRRFGDDQLGVYGRAYALLTMPFMTLTRGFGRVMLPRIARDRERGLDGFDTYLSGVRSIAWLGYPAVILAVVLVDPFVSWWLGPAWALMVPLGRIFAALALLQLIGMLEDSVAQAAGATQRQLKIMGPLKVVLILSVVVAAWFGQSVMTVALVYALVSIAYFIVSIHWCSRLLGGGLPQVAAVLIQPVLASVLAGALPVGLLYTETVDGFMALFVPAAIYAVVLLLVWRYIWPSAWRDILQPWIEKLLAFFSLNR
ncbi:MAG: oligosaccharide flippase family protein [Bacteroidota bacterium]